MKKLRLPLVGLAVALAGSASRAVEPLDELLRLAPADAPVVFAISDLRTQFGKVMDSKLVTELRAVSSVKRWREGPQARQFEKAQRDVASVLGVDLATIRNELLGEAVVLAIRADKNAGAASPRGLLLTKVRDRKLLDRLIHVLNGAARADGSIVAIEERSRGELRYSIRVFKGDAKPPEAYAILPGDVFAWSNSESLIQETLDFVRTPGKSLLESPRFQRVRAELPSDAIAQLFVDPRSLEMLGLGTAPEPIDPVGILLKRYLLAVDYVGVAAQWREGPILHIQQAIDPSKLDPALVRWAARPAGNPELVRRLPPGALLLVCGQFDFQAAFDALLSAVPEEARARIDNAVEVARGLLLGKDPKSDVLPRLGPSTVLAIDRPIKGEREDEWTIPTVLATEIQPGDDLTPAINNAFRTLLSIAAFGPNAKERQPETVFESRGSAAFGTLRGPKPASFAVSPSLIAIGNSESLVRSTSEIADRSQTTRLESARSELFASSSTFGFVDLVGVGDFLQANRSELARHLARQRKTTEAETSHDVDNAVELLKLFKHAYATIAVDPTFRSMRINVGLNGR